jgi:putative transposase
MRKSRFTEAQIVAALREGAVGLPVAELLRKHGISRQTYYSWRGRYGGATVAELTKLRTLEAEHATLKRMYAELAMEYAAIKDVLSRKL